MAYQLSNHQRELIYHLMCVADDVYAHTKTYFVYSLFRIVYMYNNELDECVCWPYTSSFFLGFGFLEKVAPKKSRHFPAAL